MSSDSEPQRILQRVFGYPEFRPGQLEITQTILSGRDVLTLLPTGGGKSLCFQVPALMLSGITIVISPLISLMKNQVDTLCEKGVAAISLNSVLHTEEMEVLLAEMRSGKYKLIYVAPERLTNQVFINVCKEIEISLLVVDEAHCISQWGHDFRPSYLHISEFLRLLQKRPVVAAFTATASGLVQREMVQYLELQQPQIFKKSVRRENLNILCFKCSDREQKEIFLFQILKKHNGECGIIYCSTREYAEQVAELLHFFGENCVSYHAGLSGEERERIQEQFLKGEVPVIVATNAFGMGIDKAEVRFVVHFNLPGNVENYYQEVGRAGRDGRPAHCYLLFTPNDLTIQLKLLKSQNSAKKSPHFSRHLSHLQRMLNFVQLKSCRVEFLLNHFGETARLKSDRNINCNHCDICLKNSFNFSSLILFPLQTTQRIHSLQKLKKKYGKLLSHSKIKSEFPLLSHNLIHHIAIHSPHTIEDYLKLPGIGKGWIEKFKTKSPSKY